MIKRTNKITALLVAATSILALVPAMASDSTSRLDSKDGTISNAIAYKDGKYIFQGYKSDDDTDSIYYNGGDKDKELDDDDDYDLSDADLNTTYGDKYAFANDGSDQYLVDLTSGSVSDDDTPSDDADSAATKLQTKLKKTDRYGDDISGLTSTDTFNNGNTINDNQLITIPGNKFTDSWYAYDVETSSNDAQKYLVNKHYPVDSNFIGHLYGFTNDSGKYIDASSTANIYAYSTKEGKTVKIEDYSNSWDDVDSDSGLLATLVRQPVALTQDSDYIYALVTVAITDTSSNAVATGITTSAVVTVPSGKTATTTLRTYIQKLSKDQGDQKDDAYLPKSVETYEVGNQNDEYKCGDATDAYDAILAAINDANTVSSLSTVEQADVLGRLDDKGIAKPLFTISDGNLVAIKASDDSIDAVTLKFKKDKLKFDTTMPGYKTSSSTTPTASKVQFDEDTKVDAYFVEKDSDDSVDTDNDNSPYEAYDIDVDGNVWVVSDGKIYQYKAGGDMTKVYSCDSSLDSISVYDENSMIAWEDDGDIYTTVNEGQTKQETPATTSTATTATVGWVQLSDGSWNFHDATGNKVVNNWANVNGIWYYLDANGTMVTGWQYISGSWYYLNANSDGTKGVMKTGWINDNGTWYFLSSSGAMQTGWINDGNSWYYLYQSGAMASNTTIDGYKLSSSGAMI